MSKQKQNFVIAKLDYMGEHFEILVKPDEARELKNGKAISINEVVVSDTIYKDAKKGLKASPSSLKKVFGTLDFEKIAKEIIERGEIPLTAEQRKEIIEMKKRQIIEYIVRNAIDPKTHLPIPRTRIESAMNEAKVTIDPNKDAEGQAIQIVKEISKVIPIKLAKALIQISCPPQYAGKIKGVLNSLGEVKKTNWLADGSLIAELEIPAGAQNEVIEKLNSLTKGSIEVKILSVR
jgi:ribosome maturation protein SDO1